MVRCERTTWQRLGAVGERQEVVRAPQHRQPLLVVLQLLGPPGLREVHHLHPGSSTGSTDNCEMGFEHSCTEHVCFGNAPCSTRWLSIIGGWMLCGTAKPSVEQPLACRKPRRGRHLSSARNLVDFLLPLLPAAPPLSALGV